jgi:hypothetical protein
MPPATDFLINLLINYVHFHLSFSPLKLRQRFMRRILLINSHLAFVIVWWGGYHPLMQTAGHTRYIAYIGS